MQKTIKIDIGEEASNEIKRLEKKVRSLQNRLEKRDEKLNKFRQQMNITEERRERIGALCEKLVEELRDSNWVDIDIFSYE